MQPLLQAFHWLLVLARIDYRVSTICHSFSDSSPTYLSDLITGSSVLLQTHEYFVFPILEQKPLANAVSSTAPKQSNSLPSDIRHIQSSDAFKTGVRNSPIQQQQQQQKATTSDFKCCLLTPPSSPLLPSLTPRYILSVRPIYIKPQ